MMLAFGQTAGNKGKTQLQNSRFGLPKCAQENNNLRSSRTTAHAACAKRNANFPEFMGSHAP
jgi:hypothetical protein